jgi:Na+/phosphate symporter
MEARKVAKEKLPKNESHPQAALNQPSDELLDALSPVIENLRRMLGAARHAFNRNNLEDVQELTRLRGVTSQEIKATLERVESATAKRPEAERVRLVRIHEILNHMQLICENIAALGEPIRKKILDKLLFTDKAFFDVNYVFTHQTGLMRSLLDFLKTDNQLLRKYSEEEAQNLIQVCLNAATEHENRLIEGICLPQASPVFLGILDHMRLICRHVLGVVKLRGGTS